MTECEICGNSLDRAKPEEWVGTFDGCLYHSKCIEQKYFREWRKEK